MDLTGLMDDWIFEVEEVKITITPFFQHSIIPAQIASISKFCPFDYNNPEFLFEVACAIKKL